jgi:tail fiber protein gp32
MASISASETVITIVIPTLIGFAAPQRIQGFAQDDVLDFPTIESVETLMGVDGKLSGGFVFKPIPVTFTLQADSPSNLFFDQWWSQMQATHETVLADGEIVYPAIGTKWIMSNGFLTVHKVGPDARRILQPRKYTTTWESVLAQPSS